MESIIAEKKYLVLRNHLQPEVLDLMAHYFSLQTKRNYFAKDGVGAGAKYADPVTESLLLLLLPLMEEQTEKQLYPTYSYVRIYKKGDSLFKHTDRQACEYSITLPILYGAKDLWPICITTEGGDEQIRLDRGDMLIYKGCDVPHWRESFNEDFWIQVFLHYVDVKGPNAEWKFDKRKQLGESQQINVKAK